MLSSTSRPLVARLARHATIDVQPARCPSNLTKIPGDAVAKPKEEKVRVGRPTIFDLKVENPINKSSVWNISYVQDEDDDEPPVQAATMREWRKSRYPPRYAKISQSGRPIRLPMASNTFSSMTAKTQPLAQKEHLFSSERRADEIVDVPDVETLSKLRAEAEKAEKEKALKEDLAQYERPAPTGPPAPGTHFLPSLDKLPYDIYVWLRNQVRPAVGIECGIKRNDNSKRDKRERLPVPVHYIRTRHASFYYPGF